VTLNLIQNKKTSDCIFWRGESGLRYFWGYLIGIFQGARASIRGAHTFCSDFANGNK